MTATGDPVRTPDQLFLEQLPVIDRIIGIIARGNALSDSDAGEFAAWARERLMDGDYAILRKLGGRSSIATYLSVVVSNLYRDHRNALWGRWRPSAAAQRLGLIGVRLKELISRDGYPLRVATGILRSAGVAESDAELTRMAAKLPNRPVERAVAVEGAAAELPVPSADHLLRSEERERLERILHEVISELPAEDCLLTRMRFWDRCSIAEIARLLHLEQSPLYPRFGAIQRRIRDSLSRRGSPRKWSATCSPMRGWDDRDI